MADILLGFQYSKSTSRYRDTTTGRFISRKDVLGLLDTQIQSAEKRLGGLVTAYHEGNVSPAWFAENMRTELKRAHLQNRALGAGGMDKLTAKDFGSVGRKLRGDYARIADLTRGIANGTVSLPQALNRVQGYVGLARLEFFEAERDAKNEAAASKGVTLLMLRSLGASEHCVDCVDYYQQGYQVSLPLPSQNSICNTHCRCSIRYREVATADVASLIGTRG